MKGALVELIELLDLVLKKKTNPKLLYDEFLSIVLKIFKADSGSFFIYKNNYLYLKSTINTSAPKNLKIKVGQPIAGWVFKNQKPLLINELEKIKLFKKIKPKPNLNSSMIFPLITDGKPIGLITINSLKKSLKYTEKDINKVNELSDIINLYTSFLNLYEKFNKKLNNLNQLNNFYFKILFVLIHELDNTLVILENIGEKLLNGEKDFLEIFQRKINYIKDISKNFYTYIKFKNYTQFFYPICIQGDVILENILKEKRKIYKNKKIELKFKKDENNKYILKADPYTLDLILQNLIDNAFKYTKNLVYVILKGNDGYTEIIIIDNGPKISNLLKKNRFVSFEEKKGLGLFIVKEFTEKNKGKIFVEEKNGEKEMHLVLPSCSEEILLTDQHLNCEIKRADKRKNVFIIFIFPTISNIDIVKEKLFKIFRGNFIITRKNNKIFILVRDIPKENVTIEKMKEKVRYIVEEEPEDIMVYPFDLKKIKELK